MDEVDDLRKQLHQVDVSLKGAVVELENERKEKDERYEGIKKKYEIVIPETTRKSTESKLKMCDDYTKNTVIKYLELDNYELVKNIAGTVNRENAGEAINHMDGGLARNYALIELLKSSIDYKKEFHDKLKGERKDK